MKCAKCENERAKGQAYCKPCISLTNKEQYEKNREARKAKQRVYAKSHKEQARASYLKREFNITPEVYKAQLERQGNQCAACHKDASECRRGLFVDHNHKTGENRGLLCSDCNAALGLIKDSARTALNLYNYLALTGNEPCDYL